MLTEQAGDSAATFPKSTCAAAIASKAVIGNTHEDNILKIILSCTFEGISTTAERSPFY